MDGDGKDECVVLAVREIELLPPQFLYDVGIDKAMGGSSYHRLQRRPIVQVPAGTYFNYFAGLHRRHRAHPVIGLFGMIRFNPLFAAVRCIISASISIDVG